MKSDLVRVNHMLDAAREIVDFTSEVTRQDLDADRKLNLSLVRLIEVIGEAAVGISVEFQQEHPSVPWREMVGMRNRLIHGYQDINLDIVWQTVQDDIPPLIEALEALLVAENE